MLRIAAWACLMAIALATLLPLGFRPHSAMSPSIERLVAFAIAGVLFAWAYPRYILFASAVVLGAAVLLEVLQVLAPSRHGMAFDAAVKIVGGICGLAAGWVLARADRVPGLVRRLLVR
jgi:apolipoprotein N-acyltransferase